MTQSLKILCEKLVVEKSQAKRNLWVALVAYYDP